MTNHPTTGNHVSAHNHAPARHRFLRAFAAFRRVHEDVTYLNRRRFDHMRSRRG